MLYILLIMMATGLFIGCRGLYLLFDNKRPKYAFYLFGGFSILIVSRFLVGGLINLHSYSDNADKATIVHISRKQDNHYQLTLVTPENGSKQYDIQGASFTLQGIIVKWHPTEEALQFKHLYRIESLLGNKQELPRRDKSLTYSPGLDLIQWFSVESYKMIRNITVPLADNVSYKIMAQNEQFYLKPLTEKSKDVLINNGNEKIIYHPQKAKVYYQVIKSKPEAEIVSVDFVDHLPDINDSQH